MSSVKAPLLVQSLIGRKNLPFYLECLDSLTRFCQDKIILLLHTDGTLNMEQMNSALNHFGDISVQFYNPKEARQVTLDNLAGHPHCQKFRQNSLWGVEFFDPLFVRPDDPISYYVDADILFLRPFSGLFEPKEVEGGALFLRDTQWDAYSLRPWHLWGLGKRPKIVRGITTALVCWDKQVIDWDYLEWFLGEFCYHTIPEWVLPTAQAGLATRCQAKTVLPEQLPNLYPNATLSKETFGVHLLGSYRQEWLPKIERYARELSPECETIRAVFNDCQRRNALGYGQNQSKRWINTRLNRW